MKRVSCLIICVCIAMMANAHDVYVYTTGNYTPVKSVKDISCIAFGSTGITIKAANGTTSDVAYDDFSYFRFFPTPVPAGIKSVAKDEASIEFDGKRVAIKVRSRIDEVEIINTSGRVAGKYAPRSEAFSFELTDKPAGVYVVKVVVGERNYVKKIVTK